MTNSTAHRSPLTAHRSPLTAHRSPLTAHRLPLSMSLPLQHPVIRRNGQGRPAPAPDVGWRERLQALRHLPKLLRMVWETEPRYVVGILLLRVARSAVPLAVLWIGKLIVDEVVRAIGLHRPAAADPLGPARPARRRSSSRSRWSAKG